MSIFIKLTHEEMSTFLGIITDTRDNYENYPGDTMCGVSKERFCELTNQFLEAKIEADNHSERDLPVQPNLMKYYITRSITGYYVEGPNSHCILALTAIQYAADRSGRNSDRQMMLLSIIDRFCNFNAAEN